MKRAQEEWKHDIVYDPKTLQDHKRSVTYFMTHKVTVTFVCRFDLVYNPKKSRGH